MRLSRQSAAVAMLFGLSICLNTACSDKPGATGDASGGASSSGTSSGGAVASGGASSGGASSGGASNGGAVATGGLSSGGASMGGASMGGTVATGGVPSGGASMGGASSGGSSSGGAGSSSGGAVAKGGASATGGSAGTTGGSASTTGGSAGATGNIATPPALTTTVTIHVAGDSTAAVFPSTDPRVGWAAVLQSFFASGVTVNDAALSGRSTKSYIDEGAWSTLSAKITAGDYLFIEFGHNDQKTDDPARYTDPATTYRQNLKTFIDGARAKGGYPVLLTSICRRYFSGTTANGTHGAYTTAVFAVGSAEKVPVIDMESKTKAWLNGLGPTNSIPMFAPDDNTHLSAQGAPEVAKLAVAGIREFAFPIASRLKP